MRESLEAKAARYLTEGRVVVESIDSTHVLAAVRGAGEVYQVAWGRGGWHCTCAAVGRCAHLLALQSVTAPVRPSAAAR